MKKTVLLIVILIMAGLISGLVLNMRINRHSSSPGFTIKYKVTRVGVDGNTIECDERDMYHQTEAFTTQKPCRSMELKKPILSPKREFLK